MFRILNRGRPNSHKTLKKFIIVEHKRSLCYGIHFVKVITNIA